MVRRANSGLVIIAMLGLWALCGSAWAEWTEPVPVGEINAEDLREWMPFLSYDGLSLYYAQGRGSSGRHLRIYRATRNEPFGPFTSITEVLRSNDDVYGAWVSLDGLRVYYTGEIGGIGVRMSERTSIDLPWSWGPGISELNSLGTIFGASLTSDELTIVISSSNIPGGLGGRDIWMATRSDRNVPFSNVTNLSEINSSANDGAASISFDGLTIYFSSNRNGTGQLFTASRSYVDEPFGPPEHLPEFDTSGGSSSQPNVSADGSTLYFIRAYATERTDIWVSYLIQDPYELAIINIEDAIAEKAEAMERIDAALEKEWAAYDALKELLESGDYGDLSRRDIFKAKRRIRFAIRLERWSKKALVKSIEQLEDSLWFLGWEPEPLPEPIAYWKFDERHGTTAYDSAGNNDGTIYGAQWTTGQINGALDFDGDEDYVRTIYEGGPSEYTISLWYNLNEDIVPSTMIDPDTGVWRARALVSKTGDEQYKVNLWSIWFSYYGLELVNEIAHNTYVRVSYEPAMFYKDEWCHVVVTGNSTHGQVYFDGELINTVEGNFSGGVWDDSVPFEIARPYTGTADRYFNGTIDEVMIFNKALSADQIQQLYEDVPGPGKGKKVVKHTKEKYDRGREAGSRAALRRSPAGTQLR